MKRTWMLNLVLLVSVGVGTAANAAVPTGRISLMSDIGGSCRDICTETTPCIRKCVENGEPLTCSAYGVCARRSCQYVPTTSPRTCHIDEDNHIWGNRWERHEETYYEDIDRRPECPGQWRTRIAERHDCSIFVSQEECCERHYGRFACTAYAMNSCHS
jgi:hypothetical protein